MKEYNIFALYPSSGSIERGDSLVLHNELEKIDSEPKDTKINLIINSSGGNIYAAYKMVSCIRKNCKSMRVVIPLYAKSAATLMALAGDEIIMGQQSELGPLDKPMEHPSEEGVRISALDGVKSLHFLSDFCKTFAIEHLGLEIRNNVQLGRKESLELALEFAGEYVQPIISKFDPMLINMCYRSLQIAEEYGEELLTDYMFSEDPNAEEKSREIVEKLVWGYPEHGFAICISEAKRIGLKVKKAEKYPNWEKIWEFYKDTMDFERKFINLIPMGEFKEYNTPSIEEVIESKGKKKKGEEGEGEIESGEENGEEEDEE